MTKYKWDIPTNKDKVIGWQGKRIIALEDELATLKVAVAWERECEAVAHWQYEVWELAPCGSGHDKIYGHAVEVHAAARAEVDRLIANCKGEG